MTLTARTLTVYLDQHQWAQLDALAAEKSTTPDAVASGLIDTGLLRIADKEDQ